VFIVLLLGSYDPQTKSYLESVKEEIAKRFSEEKVFSFLLDNLEIFTGEPVHALVELFDKSRAAIFVFEHGLLLDEWDITFEKDLAEEVYSVLKEKYPVQKFRKLPILDKFDILMRFAKAIFLVRDREETRGGEYVELMDAMSRGHSDKIWFFKREGVRVSDMLMEYLDKCGVKIRPYTNQQDLIEEIIRILRYRKSTSELS
jgi:hypothetical protein